MPAERNAPVLDMNTRAVFDLVSYFLLRLLGVRAFFAKSIRSVTTTSATSG